MINFKPKIPAMLGALAVLTAGAAHAELLEYTFKAPDGTQRSLTPNANYANPTGNISFALMGLSIFIQSHSRCESFSAPTESRTVSILLRVNIRG